MRNRVKNYVPFMNVHDTLLIIFLVEEVIVLAEGIIVLEEGHFSKYVLKVYTTLCLHGSIYFLYNLRFDVILTIRI